MTLPELFADHPPDLDVATITELAARYGLSGVQTPLASERDQNVLITSNSGEQFILKISNPANPVGAADLESDVLVGLSQTLLDVEVPRVMRTLDGFGSIAWPAPGGVRSVRLLSYLQGRPVAELKSNQKLRFSVGSALAKLSLALRGIDHRPLNRPMPWDLYRFSALRTLISECGDRTLMQRGEQLLERWQRSGLLNSETAASLPMQLLHNDFNPHNLLVRHSDLSRVSGVIDFGDMAFGPPVFDLAIALAYWFQETDSLAALGDVVSGFHRSRPLYLGELRLLPLLIETRLMMTVLITRWRAHRIPENGAYILRNEPAARIGLAALAKMSEHDLCTELRRRVSPELDL